MEINREELVCVDLFVSLPDDRKNRNQKIGNRNTGKSTHSVHGYVPTGDRRNKISYGMAGKGEELQLNLNITTLGIKPTLLKSKTTCR